MTYPEQPGPQPAGSWSPQHGWSAPAPPPPLAPSVRYPTGPAYSAGPYATAPGDAGLAAPAPAGRTGLTAGAALSFVTAVSMALAGTLALIVVVAASAINSALGSLGSSGFGSSGIGSTTRTTTSSGIGEAVLVVVITLGLAFLLFWGGLQAALGRGIGAAMAGNIIAIVLVVIAAVQSSGYVLLLAIVPALAAAILAASARPAPNPAPAG